MAKKIHDQWAPLASFIAAGRTTPETQMAFNAACLDIRRTHGSTHGNFKRALFRVLKKECGLVNFAEVAERFGFAADEIPVDELADAKAITAEIAAANSELTAATAKADAAHRRAEAAQARLDRIDTLTEQLPGLRESLAYLETLPGEWRETIATAEESIKANVYRLPKYSQVGNVADFILGWEKSIAAAETAIKSHPARLEIARKVVADVEAEIAALKSPKAARTPVAA